jgi:hypothetical protein
VAERRTMLALAMGACALMFGMPAHAQGDDAQAFMAHIDRGDTNARELLHAVGSGFAWANEYLTHVRQQAPLFCQPRNLTLSAERTAEILRQHLATHPRFARAAPQTALLFALQQAFPCPSESE